MQYLKLINTFMPYFFSSISRINSFITQFSILEQGKKKEEGCTIKTFLFPKYTDKHAMKDILFVCFDFFFFDNGFLSL